MLDAAGGSGWPAAVGWAFGRGVVGADVGDVAGADLVLRAAAKALSLDEARCMYAAGRGSEMRQNPTQLEPTLL